MRPERRDFTPALRGVFQRCPISRAGPALGWLLLVAAAALAGCDQAASPPPPVASPTAPAGAVATAAAKVGRYDLQRDERLGGHVLARHVGRTDAELAERLRREPGIRAASTFGDLATAETVIAATLEQERPRIGAWCARGPRRPNLALLWSGSPDHPIGRSLRRGRDRSEPAFAARVVLRAAGDGFYVLTAYPEER